LLGTVELPGQKLFALKFNEGRNMEWMDKVYLVQYDEKKTPLPTSSLTALTSISLKMNLLKLKINFTNPSNREGRNNF
jgi:hypothetical protein